MVDASTSELVQRAAAGDQTAWAELVDRFSRLVWAVARGHRLSSADAADVFQTTWLRLVENLSQLRDPDRIAAWLATTARFEALRMVRLRSREHLHDPVAWGQGRPDPTDRNELEPDAALLASEEYAELTRAFAQLPRRCQALLRLLVADPPPSYSEIAVTLDIPVGGIGPNRRRCLERLRRLLEEPRAAAAEFGG